jgi:hypothetical protein
MIRAYYEALLAEEAATSDLPRAERLGDPAGKMKQFATWFTHGLTGGAKLRGLIYHARTGADVLAEVDAFFAAQLAGGAESEDDAGADSPDDLQVCD